jgi:hypothetical protein
MFLCSSAERLAALAADSLGPPAAGLAAVKLAMRTAMIQLGWPLLGQLLAAEPGHRGPRIDCGQRHCAEFVDYCDKHLDTVLGAITLRRAYYHCVACRRDRAPRRRPRPTHASLPPGLRQMVAHAAGAGPFATAAGLLAELARIELTDKR